MGEHKAELIEGWKSWEPALEIRRQEMGRITPVPAQHKAAQSDAHLLVCLQTPTPRGSRGPEEAPQWMSRWRLQHITCCGASQAQPDGDPAAWGRSDLAWRLLQYNQNEWCCSCTPSLHPATLTGYSFRAQREILLLPCRKAACHFTEWVLNI